MLYYTRGYVFYYEQDLINSLLAQNCVIILNFFLRRGFLKPVSDLYKEALALSLRNYTVAITQGLSETPIEELPSRVLSRFFLIASVVVNYNPQRSKF